MSVAIICRACGGAEASWRDCDRHDPAIYECFALECDTPGGCGFIDRDCDAEVEA